MELKLLLIGGAPGLSAIPNCRPVRAESPWDACNLLNTRKFDALLATLPVADWAPSELISDIHAFDSALPVVLHSPTGSDCQGEELMSAGAFACLTGELDSCRLTQILQTIAAGLKGRFQPPAGDQPWRELLVGESRAMLELVETIRLVGPRRATVLITGETGTGKELVARAIHAAGPRAAAPMVAVNCAALPQNLLEAELFGHTKGAFTGAQSQRQGRFEAAHGGTLFLDEVVEMSLDVQAKLLRALQEREIQRIGSSETIKVDCRVVAATNADPLSAVREKRFREDLFYRLSVVPIHVPALRKRREDIPVLVEYFVKKVCRLEGLPQKEISRQATQVLCEDDWPGNVRQLEHAVERAVALCGDRRRLLPCDFPRPERRQAEAPGTGDLLRLDRELDYEETIARIERTLLSQALNQAQGNKARAAELLGMKRTTLGSKLKALSRGAAA